MGSQMVADVFFVAFRIPNFFRRLFGEGAFSAAFVPVFSEMEINHTPDEARRFLALVTGRLMLILLGVTIVGVVFAPALVSVIAPGFKDQPDAFNLAVDVTRIMFPYLFFISLVALSAGIMNTRGRFAIPAFTPVILNLCLIFGAWFFASRYAHATYALAFSVIAAGFLQLLFQLPFLYKEQALPRPRLTAGADDAAAEAGAKRVYQLILPALFGVSVAQINLLINTLLASFLVTGSISWLYYSDRLMEFPVGVFGIALATAILPKLSKDHASKSGAGFSLTLDWACRWVMLIAVPAMLALIILGEPIVTSIYHYGKFTDADVSSVYHSLVAFSFGLVPIILVKVLAPGFYAQKNTKTPVRIGMVAMGVNILFSLILFKPMAHVGLALSTSIAALVNAGALFYMLRKDKTFLLQAGWLRFIFQVVLASAAMVACLLWLNPELKFWLDAPVMTRFWRLLVLVISGGVCYGSVLFITGLRPKQLLLKG
ncbi:MAG: murein biosynthesis integral membrane protein MurJ [Arenicellales bacterium]